MTGPMLLALISPSTVAFIPANRSRQAFLVAPSSAYLPLGQTRDKL